MAKKKEKWECFGFENVIRMDVINSLSLDELKRINDMFEKNKKENKKEEKK